MWGITSERYLCVPPSWFEMNIQEYKTYIYKYLLLSETSVDEMERKPVEKPDVRLLRCLLNGESPEVAESCSHTPLHVFLMTCSSLLHHLNHFRIFVALIATKFSLAD